MAHVFHKKWRSQDVRLRENVDFSALLLSDRVLKGLQKAGFRKPSPIQLEAIPMGRFGKGKFFNELHLMNIMPVMTNNYFKIICLYDIFDFLSF